MVFGCDILVVIESGIDMEIRDLYTKNRVFSGLTISKGDVVPENLYYLVVFVIIEDSGKFLIQKRSIDKGGKWAFTSGHPVHGEDSLTGVIREVKEELGLDIKNEKITLLKTVIDDVHIIDIYHIKMNLDENLINIQEEEVADYKIVIKGEIEEIIKQGEFHKKHAQKYIELKNNKEVFN